MQRQDRANSGGPLTEGADERTSLFSTLAERLLAGEALEDATRRAHLIRLLSSLMPESHERARRGIADRIADMPSPPKDLALAVARDRADLVLSVLRNVPFSQSELIELVTRTGPAHHIEIAKRNDLTLDVWLALARAAARRAREFVDSETAAERAAPQVDFEERHGSVAAEPPKPEPSPARAPRPHPESPKPPPSPRSSSLVAAPLEDPGPTAWRYETDRAGRLVRVSPNARQAFGDATPSLIGEPFAHVVQMYAAVPAHDDIAEAMARRAPIRDLVIELVGRDRPARRWCMRARPRFSFPDGRFEGYVGTVRDLDEEESRVEPADRPAQLLDRLAWASERLAAAATTPELKDYAQAMKECIDALKAMPLDVGEDVASRRTTTEE